LLHRFGRKIRRDLGLRREAAEPLDVHAFGLHLAEPLGALVAWLLLASVLGGAVRGILFAAVAGVMVFISFDELLPTAREYGEHHIAVYGLTAGMAVMAVSLALMI